MEGRFLRSRKSPRVQRKRHVRRIILLSLVAVLLLTVMGLFWWLQPYRASAQANAVLSSNQDVKVTQSEHYIAFLPSMQVHVGLIFYPGAKVDPAAYAIYMRDIAQRGYATFIARMPLNFSFFASSRADDIMHAYPEIHTWLLGGHSLGGVSACDYVSAHPSVRGLLLYASYPSIDLSRRKDLTVVSIFGTHDGLSTPEKININKRLLPASTQYMPIVGGVHAFFGDYGLQDGDGQATISRELARAQILSASLNFMKRITSMNS